MLDPAPQDIYLHRVYITHRRTVAWKNGKSTEHSRTIYCGILVITLRYF